jgi:hypothetical protein
MLKEISTKHVHLYNKAMGDINAVKLKADTVIEELFSSATLIEVNDKLYTKALKRFRMGNPPGKKKAATIGDEVNWEALLEEVPNGADLHFVSSDSDYAAAMDPYRFDPFLDKEWTSKKDESAIVFYKSIEAFFKAKYPQIHLASDVKKNTLIEELAKSGSFFTTHLAMQKLNQMNEFSQAQVEQLIQIAQTNNQVWWIMGDADVLAFYLKLRDEHSNNLSVESLKALIELVSEYEKSEAKEPDDDIPF